MRALQLYAPKADKAAYDHAIQLAASWLAKANSTDIRRLFSWCPGLTGPDEVRDVALQRPPVAGSAAAFEPSLQLR